MPEEREINWKGYEQFVAEILRELDPTAKINHDEFVQKRQIDVTIRNKIVGLEILIIVQAKYYKRKVAVDDVDSFESVVREVGAARGIMVSNIGFTKGAREKAQMTKIELYSAHDSTKPKFVFPQLLIPVVKLQSKIKLRVVHEFTTLRPTTMRQLGVTDHKIIAEEFCRKWIEGSIDKSKGEHKTPLDNNAIFVPGEEHIDQKSFFKYEIVQRYYFKLMKPDNYKGLQDELNNNFKATFLEF